MKVAHSLLTACALGYTAASLAQFSRSQSPSSLPPKKAPVAVLKGEASYYGPEWDTFRVVNGKKKRVGNFTQSNEAFDHRLDTAACGTSGDLRYQKRHALVTNRTNGKQLVVWINDTGSFYSHKAYGGGKRVIDLAQGAARRLGIMGLGQVMVQIFPPNFCINRSWPQTKKLALAHEFLMRYMPKPPPAPLAQSLASAAPQESEAVEVTAQTAYSENPFTTKDFLNFDEDKDLSQRDVIGFEAHRNVDIPVVDSDTEDENVHRYQRYNIE